MHTIVRIEDGELRGLHEENTLGGKHFAFRSIPYAKPPVGQLRFKDPEPPVPWKGVRDATKFIRACPHYDTITRKVIGDDDCLFLNVYTPSMDTKSKLPVMFWIHGGAFRSGSSDDFVYGADYLVKKDVVLVTINYRLGVFGFLNVDNEAATGNQGLKDQVMALKWVQKNIETFGGDPNNVTIFGESAGGAMVHFHALSPMSEGLFHKAICQSGCAKNAWCFVLENNREVAIRIAAKLGFESKDPKALVEFLRTVKAHDLVKAQEDIITLEHDRKFISPIAPTFDGYSANPFFPAPPEILFKRGTQVPFIIGYTNNEGAFFTRRSVSIRTPRYDEACYKDLNTRFENFVNPLDTKYLERSGRTVDDLKRHYFGGEIITPNNIRKYIDFISDSLFIRGVYDVVDIQLQKNHSQTYVYEFSYEDGFSIVKPNLMEVLKAGATHCDELTLLFYPKFTKILGLETPKPGSSDYQVIQYLTEMWSNFARTGNPTPKVTETVPVIWEPVKKGNEYQCLHIGEKLKMEYLQKGRQRWNWVNRKSNL